VRSSGNKIGAVPGDPNPDLDELPAAAVLLQEEVQALRIAIVEARSG
jgi:hypothetical protein